MNILVNDGRVIDPANEVDEVLDLLLVDGRIVNATDSVKLIARAKELNINVTAEAMPQYFARKYGVCNDN